MSCNHHHCHVLQSSQSTCLVFLIVFLVPQSFFFYFSWGKSDLHTGEVVQSLRENLNSIVDESIWRVQRVLPTLESERQKYKRRSKRRRRENACLGTSWDSGGLLGRLGPQDGSRWCSHSAFIVNHHRDDFDLIIRASLKRWLLIFIIIIIIIIFTIVVFRIVQRRCFVLRVAC